MKKYILKIKGRRLIPILVFLIFLAFSTSCKKEEDANKDYPVSRIEEDQNEDMGEKPTDNDDKNKTSKLDESKEIIYDADYLVGLQPYRAIDFEYDEKGEVIEKEVEVNFDDCKIPYINLDSIGAKKINDKILEYTREHIFTDYEHGKRETIAYEPMAYYKYEVTDKYVSIKFEYDIGMFEGPDTVITYILDLESGQELSLDKAINIAGINEDFLGLVEGKILDFYDDMLKDYQEFDEDVYFLGFQAETLDNFWQGYYGEALNLYLNGKNQLSLFINFRVPMGGGIFQMELEIKPEDIPLKEEINPIYEYLAKEDYNLYEGGVAFLGYNSFNTMKTISSKVETIISKFGNQGKFPLSYFYYKAGDGSYRVDGDEYYLLTGKYKNSIIKIYDPIYDKDGEIVFDNERVNLYGVNCISICNLSDIRPNTKLEFIYRDKAVEFSPSLSLMDSSYINQIDSIIDLTYAYGDLEESEINLETNTTIPYMWRIFKMADFLDGY